MKETLLTVDQYDMLREIINIAMGRAASELAKLLDGFVELAVPQILLISSRKLSESIADDSILKGSAKVTAYSQTFSNLNGLDGDAIVFVDEESQRVVRNIFGVSTDDASYDTDFLYDLINMLVGACINGISNQLFDAAATFTKPRVVVKERPLREMAFETFKRRNLTWEFSLMARITFVVRDSEFRSELLVLLTEAAAEKAAEVLAELVADD